jgi:hypothetical protein
MFCERHARIVAAPGGDRIRVNYGTEDGVSAEPTLSTAAERESVLAADATRRHA